MFDKIQKMLEAKAKEHKRRRQAHAFANRYNVKREKTNAPKTWIVQRDPMGNPYRTADHTQTLADCAIIRSLNKKNGVGRPPHRHNRASA